MSFIIYHKFDDMTHISQNAQHTLIENSKTYLMVILMSTWSPFAVEFRLDDDPCLDEQACAVHTIKQQTTVS